MMDMTASVKKTELELCQLPSRDFWEGLLNEESKVQKIVHNMILVSENNTQLPQMYLFVCVHMHII